MNNAVISFNKSFQREVKVGSRVFKVIQSKDIQTLAVYESLEMLYRYDAEINKVEYQDETFAVVKQVLHQAHIDRYAIKQPT
jgi:hypothetical protein